MSASVSSLQRGTNGHVTQPSHFSVDTSHHEALAQRYTPQISSIPIAFFPGGHKSLSGISVRSFFLGAVLGTSINLSLIMILFQHYLWRIPCFVAILALFHYLEFDLTARYNTADAKISSFLLFNNGAAYNIAHCTAMVECASRWLLRRSSFNSPINVSIFNPFAAVHPAVAITLGISLVVLGQVIRSLAMKTAGRSFNHLVQSVKKQDHVLVMDGIYAWSRHPSYLGFFWWGLGTQLILGNYLCFGAYLVVLWNFFSSRITHEEKHLVQFFGQDYLNYRKRVPVLIPFIR